jgi:PAS domain S-box-containing protein
MESRKELAYDKLVKVSPVCINIIDLATRQLVQTSSWVVDHIGYSEEEFIKLSQNLFESIVHKDDRQIQLQAYEKLIQDPTLLFQECVIRFRKKSGEYLHVQIRLSVLEVDKNSRPKSSLNTYTDISEIVYLRKRLDAELRKMEIVSFKNSHQLRGPVATILGLIQLIDYDGLHGETSFQIIDALKKTVTKLDEVIAEISMHSSDSPVQKERQEM